MVTEDINVSKAQTDKGIYAALDGGLCGLKIVEKFLSELAVHLDKNGKCFMVAIDQNDIHGKLGDLIKKNGFKFEVVLNRRAGIENLFVLRIEFLGEKSEIQPEIQPEIQLENQLEIQNIKFSNN